MHNYYKNKFFLLYNPIKKDPIWISSKKSSYQFQRINFDAPPSSLMDSIASPKVSTKGKGVGAHSLVRNTSRVEGHAGAPRWDHED